jgi:NADPH:quinone reductase-like Zn-dependent oxidoreductase
MVNQVWSDVVRDLFTPTMRLGGYGEYVAVAAKHVGRMPTGISSHGR